MSDFLPANPGMEGPDRLIGAFSVEEMAQNANE